ncbi:G5 domain-containing protein, partial [Candidatus Saccharibacteria bacterium]|nr:G5 domain-containing protein [Candidatus Saccharibacteria bacterium]
RAQVVTPYITPQQIIAAAGLPFYAEDKTRFLQTPDITSDGASLVLRIDRATPFMFDLYGRTSEVRTQAETVGGMLEEKGITLGERDRVSVGLEVPIASGMNVRVWREGKQTITVDEPIPFETELVFDADREIGYRAVTTQGSAGTWAVSYEIEIEDGVELSRTELARLVTQQPKKQVETIGVKPGPNALTKSKGAQYFVDSRGISHRETYYDLPMNVVMQACGQGGYYTVRSDGIKIDRDGYVIIAANYSRYPRCTVVETSVGLAKVYDTGGFAQRHPEGFDIATDWTNYDGR